MTDRILVAIGQRGVKYGGLCFALCLGEVIPSTGVLPILSDQFHMVVNALISVSVLHMAYKGDCYQQTFGTAIGSQVSITEANLIMEDVEQRAISIYHSPPPFFG